MNEDWKDDDYLRKLDGYLHGGESTTLLSELKQRGWGPPTLEEISPEDLSRELTNLIWSLKDLQVYIDSTDHLSDHELYTELLEFCSEDTVCFAGIEGAMTGWSPIGSGSEEDSIIYLTYYADDEYRESWLKQFPDEYPLPEKKVAPYSRPWIPPSPF